MTDGYSPSNFSGGEIELEGGGCITTGGWLILRWFGSRAAKSGLTTAVPWMSPIIETKGNGNSQRSSSYLPSKASPVTETTPQSGQPRPSPVVLTRVSRVPLCRLLRCCQPENNRGMKGVAGRLQSLESDRGYSHDIRQITTPWTVPWLL